MKIQINNDYGSSWKAIIVLFLFLFYDNDAAIGQHNQGKKSKVYLFKNGKWFDGKDFVAKNFYTRNGLLTSNTPAYIDAVFDLQGKFVIPPFGEAHNHNVSTSPTIDSLIKRYLDDGIFYVKNPNALAGMHKELSGKIDHRSSIDVTFANGGLTSSGGHPISIAERQISYGTWKDADGEGGFYYTIDNNNDLTRKWPDIIKKKPDFIKVYLLYSEEYEKRKNNDSYKNWRGLDPGLIPAIVQLAHRLNLRV